MQKQKILDVLSAEFSGKHYISKEKICVLAEQMHWQFKPETMNRYLAEWRENGRIYSAGRGWYSDLPEVFSLYTEPLFELVDFLKKEFPLLDFLCWSTRQLTAFYHNLPGKFHTFVYVDRYSIRDVAASFRGKYPDWTILENPGKKESASFPLQANNVIIRPMISEDRAYVQEPFLHIENILTDFSMEADALSMIDGMEFSGIVDNVASAGRIKPGVIARRLTRRKLNGGCSMILRKYFQIDEKIN